MRISRLRADREVYPQHLLSQSQATASRVISSSPPAGRKVDLLSLASASLSCRREVGHELLDYWRKANDLVQRQEHGAAREPDESFIWEDSRRVVFQTLIVMYEIDRATNLSR